MVFIGKKLLLKILGRYRIQIKYFYTSF